MRLVPTGTRDEEQRQRWQADLRRAPRNYRPSSSPRRPRLVGRRDFAELVFEFAKEHREHFEVADGPAGEPRSDAGGDACSESPGFGEDVQDPAFVVHEIIGQSSIFGGLYDSTNACPAAAGSR